LANGELEDGHAARAEQSGVAYFGNDSGHFARPQLGYRTRVEAVFVAEGQVVEQVVNRADALGCEDFGQARANAFDVLHWSGKVQHLKGC
jgi:hypothetical protein